MGITRKQLAGSKYSLLAFIISFGFLSSIFIVTAGHAYAEGDSDNTITQSEICKSADKKIDLSQNLSVTVLTDKFKYFIDSLVSISGEVRTLSPDPVKVTVVVCFSKFYSNEMHGIYTISQLLEDANEITESNTDTVLTSYQKNPSDPIFETNFFKNSIAFSNINQNKVRTLSYLDNGLNANRAGSYIVVASVTSGDMTETAVSNFEVYDYFTHKSAFFLYLGAGFFISLMLLIAWRADKNQSCIHLYKKVGRLILLSGIAVSPILSLLFNDLELGYGPIGLVRTYVDTDSKAPEWVLNIGGDFVDQTALNELPGDETAGIQIPVYIVVFGIAGGYLRFLYDIAKGGWDKAKNENSATENSQNSAAKEFKESLSDVVLFLLAPLLAIAIWFILNQSGIEGESGKWTLAATSFTIGLVTNEVIQRLTEFSSRVIRGDKGSSDESAAAEKTIEKGGSANTGAT